jgi:cell division protein YceG involved in septum cleavage
MVNTPNVLVDQEDRVFIVPEGSTFGDVQARLYEGNYIQEAVSFGVLAKLMDYDKFVKPGGTAFAAVGAAGTAQCYFQQHPVKRRTGRKNLQ